MSLEKKLLFEIEVRNKLGEIFGETKVQNWLNTKVPAFENKTPLEFIYENEEIDWLDKMLYQIQSGEPL